MNEMAPGASTAAPFSPVLPGAAPLERAAAVFRDRVLSARPERMTRSIDNALSAALRLVGDAAAPGLLRTLPHLFEDRAFAARVSTRAAKHDPAFIARIAEADAHRARAAWLEAATAYRAALELYPLHGGYWTQLGHMRKEAGLMALAEAAYRSAAALSSPAQDWAEHLAFVCRETGAEVEVAPADATLGAARPLDAAPIEIEARALWETFLDCPCSDERLAEAMRHPSKRRLIESLIEEPSFIERNRGFLALLIAEDAA
ncbi:MAG: hypothetical protein AAF675_08970 [Pseudomonadota bacterium]